MGNLSHSLEDLYRQGGCSPHQCSERVAPDGAFSTQLGIQLHSTALPQALIRPDGCPVVRLCGEEVTNNKVILLMVSLAGVDGVRSGVESRCAGLGLCGISGLPSQFQKENCLPLLLTGTCNDFMPLKESFPFFAFSFILTQAKN